MCVVMNAPDCDKSKPDCAGYAKSEFPRSARAREAADG